MRNLKNFFPVLILLSYVLGSQLGFGQLNWSNYSYSTGNNVRCVAGQGSFLWVGTLGGGLFRFNKSTGQSVLFNKSNSDLPDMVINDVRPDGTTNLWVATANGLGFFNGTTWRIYNTDNSGIPSDIVTSIDIDANGDKWISTFNGLAKLAGNNWTVYNTSNSDLPTNKINHIRVKPTGSKWIATDAGLVRFDGASWTVHTTLNSILPSDIVNTVSFDNDLGVYAGTDNGMVQIIGDEWLVFNTSNSSIPDNFVTSFSLDNYANIWVGTANGVSKYKTGNFENFHTGNSPISSNYVNTIFIDTDDTRWIGTVDSLNKFKDTVWTKYYINHTKLPSNSISEIKVDRFGYIWFATDKGLVNYNGAAWKYFTNTKDLIIRNIAFDNSGTLWMSTNSGIVKLNGNSIVIYDDSNSGVPSNNIVHITFDVFNNLWAATDAGLVKYNGTTWSVFNTSNSAIPSNNIRYLKFQGNTLCWIATDNGLASYDQINWTVWNQGNSGISDDFITSVQIDVTGKKWIGTKNGLSYFNDTVFVNYNTGNSPLPSNIIESLLIDNNGNLFVGTFDGGISFKQDTNWVTGNIDNSDLPVNVIANLYADPSNNIYISTPLGALVVNQYGITPSLYITSVPTTVCSGNDIKVKFNNLYAFNPNNIFTVELSDANGSFATPVVIGTKASISANGSDSIICTIPRNTQTGYGFRVRVKASLPTLTSTNVSDEIEIRELPIPSIKGKTIVCFDETTSYSTPYASDLSYEWKITNGVIIPPNGNNVVNVRWSNTAKTGQLKVIETNDLGCKDSTVIDIAIYGHPRMTITGPNRVCTNQEYVYTADTSHNTRFWYAVGGKVLSMPDYNKVRVIWTSSSENGRLKLVEITPGGCEDSSFYEVVIQPSPTADIHGTDEIDEGQTVKYTTNITSPTITKKWYAVNGEIIGANNKDTVTIKWPKGGFGAVLHSQKSTAGCLDSNAMTVRIFEKIDITGLRNVCEQTEEVYEANKNLGAYALWNVVGGTIIGSNTLRTCVVKWGAPGNAIMRLIQWIPNTSYRDTVDVQVAVNSLPPKPTIRENRDTLISSADIGNQWYLNGALIPGATQKKYFTNQVRGKYAVQATASYKCVSPISSDFDFISDVGDMVQDDLSAYPNPSDGIFTINSDNVIDAETVFSVYNALGEKVMTGIHDNTSDKLLTIDLRNFSSGVYYFIRTHGNVTEKIKLILNK